MMFAYVANASMSGLGQEERWRQRFGTSRLALVVPEIDVPYFSELARDVITAAAEVGYQVMIDQTGHDHDREQDLLRGTDRNMLFDGMLFAPLATESELREVNASQSM